MIQALLYKLGHITLTFFVFVYIIFEEFVWETIAKPIYEFLHSLQILQKIEVLIHKLHRLLLLAVFLVLFIKVELLGLAAVALLAKGQVYSGVIIYLSKIPTGAFTFWLFRISKDKLMTFGWFKALYDFIMTIIDKIKASSVYHEVKTKAAALKVSVKEKIEFFKTKYASEGSHIKDEIRKTRSSIKKILK